MNKKSSSFGETKIKIGNINECGVLFNLFQYD